jgi:hypothetical protein
MVTSQGTPHLWLLVKQEEYKQIGMPGGRRTSSTIRWETRYHFEVHCHDAASTERLWKRRLLTLKDKDGGHGAQARILGQDGDAVWLFLHDQPVALDGKDGQILTDAAQLQALNPGLRHLFPPELDFYAFEDGLILIAADARRYLIRAPDFRATPYQPSDEEAFSRLRFMATRWNGGYATRDFVTRQATLDDGWVGIFSDREAAEVGEDPFGDNLKDPARVLDEGAWARRTLRTARIGRTREFSEGSHDRLFDVRSIPGLPDYLQGGFLLGIGTRLPLRLQGPEGLMVLHRTRVDTAGRLRLTRLNEQLREYWSAVLPFSELSNRWEWPQRLLLFGDVQLVNKGVTERQELIAAVDLRDGTVRRWNLTLERDDTMQTTAVEAP